jgi:hypothetical protein
MGKLMHWRTSAGYRKVYLNPDILSGYQPKGTAPMPQGAVFFAGCDTRVKRRHMRLDISQLYYSAKSAERQHIRANRSGVTLE